MVCGCVLSARAAWAQPAAAPDAGATPDAGAEPAPPESTPPSPEAPDATAPDAPPPSAPEPAARQVIPPEVIDKVDAVYPTTAPSDRRDVLVVLLVTVNVDGSVSEIEVAESGGAAFDRAAAQAMRQWRFEPAQHDGKPIASRIRVPFHFAPPEVPALQAQPVAPPPETPAPQRPAPETEPPVLTEAEALEVTVHGEREARDEDRSASDFRVGRDVVAAAPRQEGAEVLRSAPGLYIGRGEGAAVAHHYTLRGFDAEHGQDIEFRVGGLPINLPSHIHGQGYADLGFLIADTVGELRVSEGVYDPRQGDFAVAGSIDVKLSVEEADRGVRLRSGYGSFNTFRQLTMWAPKQSPEESFGAAQYERTDGFGENRAGKRATGVFQHRFGEGPLTYRVIGIVSAARSDSAGVLRKDDIDDGRVCFNCVYAYPTAEAQNALNSRFLGGFFADYAGDDGSSGQAGLWLGYDNFRIQENFTGFTQQSRTLEGVAGRGDLIEQQNRTLSLGLTGRYRTSTYRPTDWARGTVEVGVDGRVDTIDQSQNLLDASVRNQTWDQRVDAGVRDADLGFWGDLDWGFGRMVKTRLGFRADVLSYDVDDRLGNFAPATRPQDTYIVGFRRSAFGVAWGPRTSLEIQPLPWLGILAAYGEGYRSPQARTLEDGEEAPFAKVRSSDLGLHFDWGPALHLQAGGYYTHLSDDVAFHAAEGRLEPIGATQRLGAVAYGVTRPADWFVGAVSFTYVDATLLEPPPATPEEPQPAFSDGQNLPYVPPVVVRADLGVRHALIEDLGNKPLGGRLGLGYSFLSSRPLPYGAFADPVSLLDASAGLWWGPLELTFEAFNVLDAEYAAVEYNFASDWDPGDGVRPRTPARHLAAGAPASWMLSLQVTL